MATVQRTEIIPKCQICSTELTVKMPHIVEVTSNDVAVLTPYILFVPMHCEVCERDWSMAGFVQTYGTVRLEDTLGEETVGI